MRRREVSPVEVLESHLRRTERLNPLLNAVVTFAPDAAERAREAERMLMSGGDATASVNRSSSPSLLGLPFTVKDTIDTAGLRTTGGSAARAGRVPQRDADAVRDLRGRGAVLFGKTNCSELALTYDADNPVFGRTNNPHDLARTPGGSSGGCAAAVAACLMPASLGSDMIGSVRVPAHFCGVCGFKPTVGLLPARGHFPTSPADPEEPASLGYLARRVEDLALLAGHGLDSQEVRLRRSRVAFYTHDGSVPVAPEVALAVRDAAHALADAGCEVSESRPPGVGEASRLWLELFSDGVRAEVGATYAGREHLAGPAARALLDRPAPARDGARRAAATAERARLLAELGEWMKTTRLLVAPVGPAPAPPHGARAVEIGGESFGLFRALGYSQAFNLYGLPAVAVPAGRTAGGMPVGVQIVGWRGEDALVLAAARAVEHALGGWRPPALSNGAGDRL
jgi:Asp-tRNA(Asn)/Glu-tRNA(Gln) amidotransferase A subunit family amidase